MKTKKEIQAHLNEVGYSKKTTLKIMGWLIGKGYDFLAGELVMIKGEGLFGDFLEWADGKEEKASPKPIVYVDGQKVGYLSEGPFSFNVDSGLKSLDGLKEECCKTTAIHGPLTFGFTINIPDKNDLEKLLGAIGPYSPKEDEFFYVEGPYINGSIFNYIGCRAISPLVASRKTHCSYAINLHSIAGEYVFRDNACCENSDIKVIRPATESEKQKLIKAIEQEYRQTYSEKTKSWEDVKPKVKKGDYVKKDNNVFVVTEVNEDAFMAEGKKEGDGIFSSQKCFAGYIKNVEFATPIEVAEFKNPFYKAKRIKKGDRVQIVYKSGTLIDGIIKNACVFSDAAMLDFESTVSIGLNATSSLKSITINPKS